MPTTDWRIDSQMWKEDLPQPMTCLRSTDVLWFDGAAGGEARPLESLRGKRARVFCGIGNPDAFVETVRGLGAVVADVRVFPDHHEFAAGDLADLAAGAGPESVWVTTEKDLQRLGWLAAEQRKPITPLAVPRVRTEILKNGFQLDIAIERALNGRK